MTSRDFAISFLALSVVSVCSLMGRAQTLPIGSVEALTPLNVCPSGFYLGPAGNQTQCYEATINCPNTNYINVTFGYLAPTPDLGTVVFFSREGGRLPLPPPVKRSRLRSFTTTTTTRWCSQSGRGTGRTRTGQSLSLHTRTTF